MEAASAASSPGSVSGSPVVLRVYHECEKARSGRSVQVDDGGLYPGEGGTVTYGVSGAQIHAALAGVYDLKRLAPHVYSAATDCFVAVAGGPGHFYAAEDLGGGVHRLDVRLLGRIDAGAGAVTPRADTLLCDSASSELRSAWFGVGICRGKVASNHGSLWRTALQMGASYTFTVGRRYDRKAESAADVYKSWRQMPCFAYESVAAFAASAPVDAQWVAVEYGGNSLTHFRHPKRAVYILGAEDSGLPPALVGRAHHHVSIPVAPGRPASLNVAAAGAIVLWDRLLKISASTSAKEDEHAPVSTHTPTRNVATPSPSNRPKRFSAPVSSLADVKLGDESTPESPTL